MVQGFDGEYTPGQSVALLGLEANSELNGRAGSVVRRLEGPYELHGKSLYVVRLLDGANVVVERTKMAPHCATQEIHAVGVKVLIDGVKSRAALNGTEATIVEHEPQKGRYIVELANGDEVSLKEQVLFKMAS